MDPDRRRERISHELHVQLLVLAAALPAVAFSIWELWAGGHSPKVVWTVILLIGVGWVGAALAVRDAVANPLRTIANLLEAMREGDYSIRARRAPGDDALAHVMQQGHAM